MTLDEGLLAGLRASFDLAEKFGREVSGLRDDIPVPAYNQLRYAGYHLLRAFDDNAVVIDESQIKKAIGHCERAMYDAAEAGILQAIKEIADFRREYAPMDISAHMPEFGSIRRRARAAQSLIIEGRNNRGTIEEHVAEYMETFRALAKDIDLMEDRRDGLNAVRAEKITEARRFWITIAVMVSAPLIIVAGSILVSLIN